MDKKQQAEKMLASYMGRKEAVLAGRGATALWALFSSLPARSSKVLVPTTLCLSPVFSVLYAGHKPVFCDVLSNGCLNPVEVENHLREDPAIGTVLMVHLFGIPADITSLEDICKKHDVFLIEDACQALGGKDAMGNLFGTCGLASVVSFGHTKILELGSGGAILTDDPELARKMRQKLATVKEGANLEGLTSHYRDLFYSVWEAGKKDNGIYQQFHQFPELFKSLYFKEIANDLPDKVIVNLAKVDNIVRGRMKIAKFYYNSLENHPLVYGLTNPDIGCPWRFNFKVSSRYRDDLVGLCRNKGFDVSTWYPSIANWFAPENRGCMDPHKNYSSADLFEKEIINLWVTPEYSGQKSAELVTVIRGYLDSHKAA